MMRRRAAGIAGRATSSLHASQDEATDRLYWLLMTLDPDHTVPWGEVERRAIAGSVDGTSWRLLEARALASIVSDLRGRRISHR